MPNKTKRTKRTQDKRLKGLGVDAYIGKDRAVVIHVDTPNVPDNSNGPVCRIYLNDDTDAPLWNNADKSSTRLAQARRAVAKRDPGLLPAGAAQRKYYLIDFVYTENDQQFGTGADLNEYECVKLEKYLCELEADGWITDPHVHEPGAPVHQSYAKARKEIAAALRS